MRMTADKEGVTPVPVRDADVETESEHCLNPVRSGVPDLTVSYVVAEARM
jgi:hypothetical protein